MTIVATQTGVRKTMSTVLADPAEMIAHSSPRVIHNGAELGLVEAKGRPSYSMAKRIRHFVQM